MKYTANERLVLSKEEGSTVGGFDQGMEEACEHLVQVILSFNGIPIICSAGFKRSLVCDVRHLSPLKR